MKTRIAAALALLNELHQAGHIRDEGNVKFQAAKTELETALTLPDADPIPVASPDLAAFNEKLASIDEKLAGMPYITSEINAIKALVTPAQSA